MEKIAHSTDQAPAAIGTYSQAIEINQLIFLSGQIPLDPNTQEIVSNDIQQQAHQVFKNISAVLSAAGSEFKKVVKLNIYLTNLNHFSIVNEVMSQYFETPYPARAAVEVSALPKNSLIEIEGIAHK